MGEPLLCRVTRLSGLTLFEHSGRELAFRDTGEQSPDWMRFFEVCGSYITDKQSRPGCSWTATVLLYPEKLMKRWWCQERFQKFFFPDGVPDCFRTHRETRRRGGTYRAEPIPKDPSRLASVEGFFSTAPAHVVDASLPPRKKGRMVWVHKTAPELEINGEEKLRPEDYEKMRRR